jgi:acyl carrier protein
MEFKMQNIDQIDFDEMFTLVSAGLAQTLCIEANVINLKQDLHEDLMTDELDFIDLTMFLEEKLDCSLPDDIFSNTRTPEDVVNKLFEILS